MPDSAHPFLADDFLFRWSTLVPSAVEADIRLALDRAGERIEALCVETGDESEEPGYADTLLAFEEATDELSRAWGLVSHLDSVCNSDDLRAAYNAMLPEVTQFFSRIPLNEKLWRRIERFANSEEGRALAGPRKRFLEETVKDFEREGANLPPEAKEVLQRTREELAQVTQKFSENVLDSTNAWELVLEDDSRLGGLPDSALSLYRSEAAKKEKGTPEEPHYRITLQAPSFLPVLEYADDESLRREIWEASTTIGRGEEYDNTTLIQRILALRQEVARILGKDQFADQVLEERMAKDGATALAFVDDLAAKTRPFFEKEITELEEFRK